MSDVANFLKKELIKYIKQEVDRGVSLKRIRDTLLKSGHHRDLIQEAIAALKKNRFNVIRALDEKISDKLKRKLYFDVMNSLIKYIEYHIGQGHSIQEIEKNLVKYGHTHETIISAIDAVMKERHKEPSPYKVPVVIISVVTLALAFFVLSSTAKVALSRVIFGLLPTIVSLIIVIVLVEKTKEKRFLWLIPVVITGIFFIMGTSGSFGGFGNVDVKNLSLVNLVMSLFYVSLIIISSYEEKSE